MQNKIPLPNLSRANDNNNGTDKSNYAEEKVRRSLIRFIVVVLLFAILTLVILHCLGWVWAPWTGFGDFTSTNGEFIHGKTLWDWLQLLIIPLLLSYIALRYQNYIRTREAIETKERYEVIKTVVQEIQEENFVNTYIDKITELLEYENSVSARKWEIIRSIGRARTLVVLRRVKSDQRRKDIFHFLLDSKLLCTSDPTDHSLISFKSADLNHVNFSGLDLSHIDFTGANLNFADFSQSILVEADFSDAKLKNANFNETEIINSKFDRAIMENVNFISGRIIDCTMIGANLSSSLMKGMKILNTFFTDGRLIGIKLYGCETFDCNFENAQMQQSHIYSGYFGNCKVNNASFGGASIDHADLEGTILSKDDHNFVKFVLYGDPDPEMGTIKVAPTQGSSL